MRTILITSGGKGGTGKTTIALNLSVSLSYMYRKDVKYPVILVDLGFDTNTATTVLSEGKYSYNFYINDFLEGKIKDLSKLLYVKSWRIGNEVFHLVFTPSKPLTSMLGLSMDKLSTFIDKLSIIKPKFIIIDSPASNDKKFMLDLARSVEHVLPIVTPDHSCINAVSELLRLLSDSSLKLSILKPILNMLNTKYINDPVTGMDWLSLVKKVVGKEPHIVPFDKLLMISRQALEIEVLKISPYESEAVKAILNYVRELISILQ